MMHSLQVDPLSRGMTIAVLHHRGKTAAGMNDALTFGSRGVSMTSQIGWCWVQLTLVRWYQLG